MSIVLVCGPPACLKSTLVQLLQLIYNYPQRPMASLQFLCIRRLHQILSKRTQSSNQVSYVSFDRLFDGHEGDIIEHDTHWRLYRALIADEIERILLLATESQCSSNLTHASSILARLHQSMANVHRTRLLIIEDNFYYSSMRHRYRQIAQRVQIGFACIHLRSDVSVALERNRRREASARVSDLSIENIFSKYEYGNDDLIVDISRAGLSAAHLGRIVQRIEQACREPERVTPVVDDEQRRLATEINDENVAYQIDQKLRKFISKYLKDEFSSKEKFQATDEKRRHAENVNAKRQAFLESVKQRLIPIDSNEDIEHTFRRFLDENH
jgi:tRNA uridine 5-carbamoylmethylation protein Kti12